MFIKNNRFVKERLYEVKEVEVWKCPNCIGWMQKEFTFSQTPTCPFCSTNMIEGLKSIHVMVQ
jgi:hypothetical protein